MWGTCIHANFTDTCTNNCWLHVFTFFLPEDFLGLKVDSAFINFRGTVSPLAEWIWDENFGTTVYCRGYPQGLIHEMHYIFHFRRLFVQHCIEVLLADLGPRDSMGREFVLAFMYTFNLPPNEETDLNSPQLFVSTTSTASVSARVLTDIQYQASVATNPSTETNDLRFKVTKGKIV